MECMNEMEEMFSKFYQGLRPPPEGHHRGPPGGHHHGHHHGPHHVIVLSLSIKLIIISLHYPFQFQCFMSCVLNKTGIFVDGELQEDNLNDYLNGIYDDSEQIDFIDEIVHKCDEKRRNHPMKKPINRHGPFQCPYNNESMLGFCTFIHAFKECPDSIWTNTDECNELREHFRQCKPPHHHGPNEDDADIEEEYIDADQAEEDI